MEVVGGAGAEDLDLTATKPAGLNIDPNKVTGLLNNLARLHAEKFVASGKGLSLDEEERGIIETLLKHGRAIRAERSAAAAAGREPDFNRLVRAWGGVTIVYRKRLQDSPAYRLNHEEVVKSLEEGIHFAECLNPVECIPDAHGAVSTSASRSVRKYGASRCTRSSRNASG